MKKPAPKPKPKPAAKPRPRSRELTVDERFDRLMLASAAADRRAAAADRRADRQIEAADRRADRQIEAADRRAAADRKAADQRVDKVLERMDEFNRLADQQMREYNRLADQQMREYNRAADQRMREYNRAADQRVDEALKKMGEIHQHNEGYRTNAARALEDFFAASLPRVMKEARGIEIKPESILMRAQKSNHTREFDFIAPNGELVLAGEVKTRLTGKDVKNFRRALESDFRALFPEYADLPVYGVVAGAGIDRDAAQLARRYGFYILRMEGSALHPDTGKTYRPKKY